MEILRELTKEWLVPGSLLFLVAGLSVGVLLLFGSAAGARWGRRWLAGLLACYLVLSLQGTSDLLSWTLSRGYRPLRERSDAAGATTIVVLGNGSLRVELARRGVHALSIPSAYNALEAARVYRLLGAPTRVLASGGPMNSGERAESRGLASALRDLGVPAEAIVLEEQSFTTYTQGVNVAKWLRAHGESTCVLITAPEHMRRATAVMHALGIRTIPSVSSVDYGGPPFWRPTAYALQGSRSAIYEYLALLMYWWRDWL